ncbi:hypothetical protein O181_048510 [Austropuccinia psidii MF-1]|uniref:Retrovirus-related Pol polyprotein from transposon TNT 1-94-like beta-barrel domain-containing protein n=1 Tax=Austropuccinia psidii MF-1 TaxID=1389203 RepID=A0A9Q3HP96_9BASI|nr:hypothetical protein [Austropuccinia psidii MF-1]
MDWQRRFYNGNLQSYIDTCRKLLLKPESVSIKVPNALLLYSLLGKLAGDSELHQFIESLTLNRELIEKPDLILTRLQDYVHVSLRKLPKPLPNSLIRRKDQCWAENPHLRPNQKENKKRKSDSSAYLSIVKALITVVDSPPKDQILLDCGATHHMFNSRRFFTSLTNSAPIDVSTGDSTSSLTAVRVGTANLICKNKVLILNVHLYVPNIKCNLISLLALLKNKLIINQFGNKFNLETNAKVIANVKIVKRLIYVDYTLQTTHLATGQDCQPVTQNQSTSMTAKIP